ncbi:unnamed protein product [Nezara viridula]|uniref:Uncharacterized protein n=1 Tax=Nezara viridula TaxID=85310 RepID=A0A9P0HLR4_NEZVI|nr:unnamed protein product [Nezara viridula]
MNVLHFIVVLICCTSNIDGMLPDECIDPYLNDNGLDSNSSNKANSCVFDVLNDMPGKYEPLFLQNNIHGSLTLTIPKVKNQRAVIKLKKGEKITISCPGNGNYIEAIDTIQSDGSCKSGNMLKIEGVNYSFQQLDCRARVNAKFKKTGMKCGRGKGVIVELGYDVPGHFLPVVEVCYNIDESIPYYSRHLLRGTSLGKEPRKIGRPAYASGGGEFFKGFNPKEAYSKVSGQCPLNSVSAESF